MAKTTIEWADFTFNPWIGCTRISEGCQHCYAERYGKRFGVEWGPRGTRRRTSDDNWKKPIAWNKKAEREGRRYSVFCASLADVFDDHESIKDRWRHQLVHVIVNTPHLDWLLLTKRPENLSKEWECGDLAASPAGIFSRLQNVRIGVTCENREQYNTRYSILRSQWQGPNFVSYEPAIGPLGDLDLEHWSRPDLIIAGGESGPGARPAHPDWFRSVRDQCRAAGVPFFFKQWGEWAPAPPAAGDTYEKHRARGGRDYMVFRDGAACELVGKKRAGRLLDGREWNERPAADMSI